MTCVQFHKTDRMATRIKMMKLLQEMRGIAEFTNRHPPARTPGLFLLQLRASVAQSAVPKRRLVISVAMKDQPDIPHPVRITHRHRLPRGAAPLADTPLSAEPGEQLHPIS